MSSQANVDLFLNHLFNQEPNNEIKAALLTNYLLYVDSKDYPQLLAAQAKSVLIQTLLFHPLLIELFLTYENHQMYAISPIDEQTILSFLLETSQTQLHLITLLKNYQLHGKAKERDILIKKLITAAPNSMKTIEAFVLCKRFVTYDLVPIIEKCAKQHILALELANKKNAEPISTSAPVIKFLSKRRTVSCFCFITTHSESTSQRILTKIEAGKTETAESIISAKQEALNRTWHKRMNSY
jgi:hypothetical protein